MKAKQFFIRREIRTYLRLRGHVKMQIFRKHFKSNFLETWFFLFLRFISGHGFTSSVWPELATYRYCRLKKSYLHFQFF